MRQYIAQIYLRPFLVLGCLFSSAFGWAGSGGACQLSLKNAQLNDIEETLEGLNRTNLIHEYFYSEGGSIDKDQTLLAEKGAHEVHVVMRPNRSGAKLIDRLNIKKMMTDFSLSRLQAIEVQALLRRFAKSPNDEQFKGAIDLVKQGYSLSGLDIDKVRSSRFVIALDADGTLFDQESKLGYIDNYHVSSFLVDGNEINHVAINHEAIKFVRRARELGASVILFSRNSDTLIHSILEKAEIADGQPLGGLFDGVFTSSHMVVPETGDKGFVDISSSRILRKDLSMFGVERIMIIDDDPSYVLQRDKVRVVPVFNMEKAIDRYYVSKYDDKYEKDYEFDSPKKIKHYRLTKYEEEKKVAYFRKLADSYSALIQQLEFLNSHLDHFNEYLAAMSPLGEEAIRLLTNTDFDYVLEGREVMTREKATAHIVSHPEEVYTIITSKKTKKKVKLPRRDEDWKNRESLKDWYSRTSYHPPKSDSDKSPENPHSDFSGDSRDFDGY